MRTLITVIFLSLIVKINAQNNILSPKKLNPSQIYEGFKKLNFLGSILYVAAHPDDENTTAISYFANKVKARTAYLSLTRGDGGQNIIGPELREMLGVIRTHELLSARSIDGGEQLFTRANDFGYSKHPDETLSIWNKKEVLSDVVRAIRNFKPDIVINRFDHRTPGTTHGHHTSSAMLSVEAYTIANDKTKYPKQLKNSTIWQPKRLLFNTSWWFYGGKEKFEKADKSNFISIDMGNYYTDLGFSNTEIAALSRSQHKSQGFGTTGKRGENINYFEIIKGSKPSSNNLFEGINTSWTRVEGGEIIQKKVTQLIEEYNFKNPQESIPLLIEVYQNIQKLKDSHWKSIKSKEVTSLITACAGLYLEAISNTAIATKNNTITLNIEAINRSKTPIKLEKITVLSNNKSLKIGLPLHNNKNFTKNLSFSINKNFESTNPYWLNESGSIGMYAVSKTSQIGAPLTKTNHYVRFLLSIQGTQVSIDKPIVYKKNNRVKGEVYYPFEIAPPVSVKLGANTYLFPDESSKSISVTVTANTDNFEGVVTLNTSKTWEISPKRFSINIPNKNQSKKVVFTLSPPKTENNSFITPVVLVNGTSYSNEMVSVDYNHIPQQNIFLPAKAKVVRLKLKKEGNHIGYIHGAGDAIPKSLEQIGYQVSLLDPKKLNATELKKFDAIVVGIRAYNVNEAMKNAQALLLEYVTNGGTLISQYNTKSRSGNTNVYAPYPLLISRDRVTDENSEVRILAPKHAVLNYPNKITPKDFEGWTQERGLYFPNEWSSEYTPILSMNDQEEAPKNGSLLVASHGKGFYIYTGLSFFRELPAGVSGAYKLFANLLSVGKQPKK